MGPELDLFVLPEDKRIKVPAVGAERRCSRTGGEAQQVCQACSQGRLSWMLCVFIWDSGLLLMLGEGAEPRQGTAATPG